VCARGGLGLKAYRRIVERSSRFAVPALSHLRAGSAKPAVEHDVFGAVPAEIVRKSGAAEIEQFKRASGCLA